VNRLPWRDGAVRRTVEDDLTGRGGNVHIRHIQVIPSGFYALRRYTFDLRRRDGSWRRLQRDAYDRGDTAVVLPYCSVHGTVLLTRQFRLPTYLRNGSEGGLIEPAGGLLDGEPPAEAVRREALEETGYQLTAVREVFRAYMSPAVLTEQVYFFVGEFDPDGRVTDGGGIAAEGEDIEVMEIALDEAIAMIDRGEIVDARAILLLQYLKMRVCQ